MFASLGRMLCLLSYGCPDMLREGIIADGRCKSRLAFVDL